MAATQIDRDAITILGALADAPRGEYVDRENVAASSNLPPDRVNDAVALLVEAGHAEWIQTFGTAPYDFNAAMITSRGRYEHQRLASAAEQSKSTQSEAVVERQLSAQRSPERGDGENTASILPPSTGWLALRLHRR